MCLPPGLAVALPAIDDLNARNLHSGGKPLKFKLVAADDQADPKTGTLAAQQLHYGYCGF